MVKLYEGKGKLEFTIYTSTTKDEISEGLVQHYKQERVRASYKPQTCLSAYFSLEPPPPLPLPTHTHSWTCPAAYTTNSTRRSSATLTSNGHATGCWPWMSARSSARMACFSAAWAQRYTHSVSTHVLATCGKARGVRYCATAAARHPSQPPHPHSPGPPSLDWPLFLCRALQRSSTTVEVQHWGK